MKFYKYEATGNDFILIDLDENAFEPVEQRVVNLCNRHYGIGADGVVLLKKEGSKYSMRIFNSDGSEAQMCGNGIRCVGVYLKGKYGGSVFNIETLAGLKTISVENEFVKVDMGRAMFCSDGFNRKIKVLDRDFEYIEVNMGNPHRVIFVPDIQSIDILKYGPLIEHLKDCCFERSNVEFVEAAGDTIYVRVWERGAGATLSCGTGACASKAAYKPYGRTTVILPGGKLEVESVDGRIYLTGPANKVFEGYV